MAVKAVLCGNTYESRFDIKDKGFVWDARRHNWTNGYTNVAPAVDAIEGIEGLTGVRATIYDGTSSRLLWWQDFGRFVPELSGRNEGQDAIRRPTGHEQVEPEQPTIVEERRTRSRRTRTTTTTVDSSTSVIDAGSDDHTVESEVELRGRINQALSDFIENVIDSTSDLAQAVAERQLAVEGTGQIEPVINSTGDVDALSEYMNSRGYTSTEGFHADDGMAGEVVLTIPRWLAIDRGCAKKLRGHIVAKERRQVEIRGAVREIWCYHFIGHNEIGNTEACHRCGRRLTHPVSRVVGYGPECCSRLGISRRVDMNDLNNVETMTQLIMSQNVDVWLPMSQVRYVML